MNVTRDFFTLEGENQKVLCVKIFFLVQKIVLILLNNCNPKTTELWNMPSQSLILDNQPDDMCF